MSEPIRDFLYVDDELVTSLYSQIFEGVAESIVETYISGSSQEVKTPGSPFSGEEISAAQEGKKTTQSRVLYDHMYSQLERKLEAAVENPSALDQNTCSDQLADVDLIQVTGETSVADFEFMNRILENWSAIADAIVEGQVQDSKGERQAKREALRQELKDASDRNEEAKIEKMLESIPSEDEFRERVKNSLGLHETAEWNENHLSLILNLWYGNNFEAVIRRPDDDGVAFRGVLKREGLRQKKSIQRLSNAGRLLRDEWSMVGLIQRVPDYAPDPDETGNGEPSSGEDALLRDNFRDMFQSLDQINEMIYMSGKRREVLVRPLAIYRNLLG